MSEVQNLNAKISSSLETAAEYEAKAEEATAAYKKALVDGDLEAARTYQREAEEHTREATLYRDNAEAFEAHREDAEIADGLPILEDAKRRAQQAIEAEEKMISEAVETITAAINLREVITRSVAGADDACRAAISAADDAHQPRPTFQRAAFPSIDLRPLDDFDSIINDRVIFARRSRNAIDQLSKYGDRQEIERAKAAREARENGRLW